MSVPARVGLVGHPSDGYGGATLAVTLGNFAAQVDARPAGALLIEPIGPGQWHDGGEPLVRAAVRVFCGHCAERDVAYEPLVEIGYRSTIPREVGLAGSSAIVIATLKALAAVSRVPIELERLPALALAVEADELGIVAGLQDRVVQSYGGLVFVDFEAGRHQRLDPALLPELFVAWDEAAAGGSGLAHAAVRARYAAGDPGVVAAMQTLAGLARDGSTALERGDHDAFGAALDAGYDVRAGLFDLDPRHTAMVDAARRLGLPATYTGSGGAIVGLARDADAVAELARQLRARGVRLAAAAAHPRLSAEAGAAAG